jgi:hypothetical protein
MANQPIGVTFMPSADNQQQGPQQGALNGPGGDLSEAFRILGLRLPRVLGPGAISSPRLLNGPGASAFGGGVNPSAAVFEALLKAMTGGGSPMGSSYGGSVPGSPSMPGVSSGPYPGSPVSRDPTRLTPGAGRPDPGGGPIDNAPAAPPSSYGGGTREPFGGRGV